VLALAADRRKVCLGPGSSPFEAEPGNVQHLKEYIACKE
jgi:hypothetical protein